VDGIKAGRPDATRLAATNALMNSLDLCRENFTREGERNMLMTVVCEATQCGDPRVRSCAYECMGRVTDLYYEHLEQRCGAQRGGGVSLSRV
jgi:importin subunit beta-1